MPLRRRAHDLTGVWLKEILADTGYASALDLVDCTAGGCVCSLSGERLDQSSSAPRRTRRQIPKSEFTWQAEEQVYVCPRGHRLTRISREAQARAEGRTVEVTTYRCPQGALPGVPPGTAVHQRGQRANDQAERT